MNPRSEGGMTVVVTGATSGLGKATVARLLDEGADVVAIGRDPDKCAACQEELSDSHDNGWVRYITCDLSTTDSVRAGARSIRAALADAGRRSVDALVNNAATVSTWRMTTEEGYELQFAVNHLAAFAMTRELLPLLEAGHPGRVVVVTSGSHRHGRMHWRDLMLTRGYSMLRAYGQSKLANVLFCREFNARSSHVRAFAYDPGLMRTDIGLKGTGGIERLVWEHRRRSRHAIDPSESATHLVRLATRQQLPEEERFYRYLDRPVPPAVRALDQEAARRLWMVSERLCSGVTLEAR